MNLTISYKRHIIFRNLHLPTMAVIFSMLAGKTYLEEIIHMYPCAMNRLLGFLVQFLMLGVLLVSGLQAESAGLKITDHGRYITISNSHTSVSLIRSSMIIKSIMSGNRMLLNNTSRIIDFKVNGITPANPTTIEYSANENTFTAIFSVDISGKQLKAQRSIRFDPNGFRFSYALTDTSSSNWTLNSIEAGILPWCILGSNPNIVMIHMNGDIDKPVSKVSLESLPEHMKFYPATLYFPGSLYYEKPSEKYFLAYCVGSDVGFYINRTVSNNSYDFRYYANMRHNVATVTAPITYYYGTGLMNAYSLMGKAIRRRTPPDWWFHTMWVNNVFADNHMTYNQLAALVPEMVKTGANGYVFQQTELNYNITNGTPNNYAYAPNRGTEQDFANLINVLKRNGMKIAVWVTLYSLSFKSPDWNSDWAILDPTGNNPTPAVWFDIWHMWNNSNPGVRSYLKNQLNTLVKTFGVDCIWFDSACAMYLPDFSASSKEFMTYPSQSNTAVANAIDYYRAQIGNRNVAFGIEGASWDQNAEIRTLAADWWAHPNPSLIKISNTPNKIYAWIQKWPECMALGTSQIRQAAEVSYSGFTAKEFEAVLHRAQEDMQNLAVANIIKAVGCKNAKVVGENIVQIGNNIIIERGCKGSFTFTDLPQKKYMVRDLALGISRLVKTNNAGEAEIAFTGGNVFEINLADTEVHSKTSISVKRVNLSTDMSVGDAVAILHSSVDESVNITDHCQSLLEKKGISCDTYTNWNIGDLMDNIEKYKLIIVSPKSNEDTHIRLYSYALLPAWLNNGGKLFVTEAMYGNANLISSLTFGYDTFNVGISFNESQPHNTIRPIADYTDPIMKDLSYFNKDIADMTGTAFSSTWHILAKSEQDNPILVDQKFGRNGLVIATTTGSINDTMDKLILNLVSR